ncbi:MULTISPECIES: hypothetical protein [unclassified Mesorhizobium]|uniref:hypothetical protein n=1 Tax=unclassified Mesorhizobium TaxID=325217 RepID=UPI00112DE3B2|nr:MULTISPECIES: hypothetical protein [unclassified Mesorhizobium]TPI18355.1 hypothetical protein FJW10_19225 [Mesorhizobium sp. B4-1-1]TPL46445.1 hypothetical protein FJ957_17005 [Mesorhizobium sp. B2-4-6]
MAVLHVLQMTNMMHLKRPIFVPATLAFALFGLAAGQISNEDARHPIIYFLSLAPAAAKIADLNTSVGA